MDELEFHDRDGVDVFFRRWLPESAASRIVLVAHGMSEHSGRYARVANALRDRGVAVYALDHRGHGRTGASSAEAGEIGPSGIDGVLGDILQLGEIARSDVGDVPVVLFGHSMGALLALGFAERHGETLAGLALSGFPGAGEGAHEAAAMVREMAASGVEMDSSGVLAAFNASFEPPRTSYDWLSRDDAEVDLYIADPYCGDDNPLSLGYVAEIMAMTAEQLEPSAIARIPMSLPIALLTGEADVASNFAANVRTLESSLRAAGLEVDAIYYPEARHEILNEINRDEVEADLLAWIDKRVPL